MQTLGSSSQSQQRIHRTLYRFGSLEAGHFGHVALHEDGRVTSYVHPNEHGYVISGGELRFLNAAGETTNTLRHYPDANVFLSSSMPGLYLMPVVTLDQPAGNTSLKPLLVNSIPKSGTYFLEAAMAWLGARPLRLHLAPFFCHDYRGVAEENLHRSPDGFAVPAPTGGVAHLMRPGDLAVGHVDDHGQLDEAVRAGVTVLHVIRNLRDVLASLYAFKIAKVQPISAADAAWRGLPPEPGFIAFLCQFESLDIAHIINMANVILERREPVLRYEDAVRGIVPPGSPVPGLDAALRATCGQPTSTLSQRDRSASLWSPAAEAFFAASGLRALNERLGYEPGFSLRHAAE
ncbi:MAG: hypothetical protein PHU07_09800 [Acidocella sp.]|nr:hypothetical protein [Acidocella sp.]